MKKLFDLRFVIGIFFLVVGSMLLIFSLVSTPQEGFHSTVNFWCSISFLIFAALMLILSIDKKPVDKSGPDH